MNGRLNYQSKRYLDHHKILTKKEKKSWGVNKEIMIDEETNEIVKKPFK